MTISNRDQQRNVSLFNEKKLLIFSDEEFAEFLNILLESKILETSNIHLIRSKANIISIENDQIKVHLLYRIIPKSLAGRLKIKTTSFDYAIYLGNNPSILRFIEKVFKKTSFVYIGNLSSKSALITFAPDFNLKKSAYTFTELIKKIHK